MLVDNHGRAVVLVLVLVVLLVVLLVVWGCWQIPGGLGISILMSMWLSVVAPGSSGSRRSWRNLGRIAAVVIVCRVAGNKDVGGLEVRRLLFGGRPLHLVFLGEEAHGRGEDTVDMPLDVCHRTDYMYCVQSKVVKVSRRRVRKGSGGNGDKSPYRCRTRKDE